MSVEVPDPGSASGRVLPQDKILRRRKRVWRRIRRVALWTLAIILVMALSGAIYQAIATARDLRRFPPPGEMVEVGGERLHYQVMGQGDITVILEAGSGGWSLHWSRVQPEVAKFTRVLAYDRAGTGWSDASSTPRTSRQIAEELHDLLAASNIRGPYVLVGHSSGGYHVRMFAHRYPDEVAGLVLVDPSNEGRLVDLTEQQRQELSAAALRQGRFRSAMAYFGIVRLYLAWAPPDRIMRENAKLPAEERPKELALGQLPKYLMADAREGAGDIESGEQVRAIGDLKNLPLVLLTAERDGLKDPAMKYRMQMHARQAHLSSVGRHITVPKSSHQIQLDQPHAVVEAIREVVEQVPRTQR